MLRNRNLAVALMGLALASLPALAQEYDHSEFSVQAFGSFVTTTTQNGIQQSASNSGGVLANYRYFFTKSNGVEVNYGYSLNTQNLGLASGPLGVRADQHEFSAEYVFRHKMHGLTPFVEAGAAGLVFDPRDTSFGASTQTRAALVYGAGVDIDLSSHFFARAEYRGFVYDSPTFGLLAEQGTDRITHRAEPSVGFGYRF
jgi:outer membrane immunogenic protein